MSVSIKDILTLYKIPYVINNEMICAGYVFLGYSRIGELPDDIGFLSCDNLDLTGCGIKKLPDGFVRLKCKELSLAFNSLEPCLWLFKEWNDKIPLNLRGTCMYKKGARTIGDYRKEIDLAYELRKPDNDGKKSMFDMGLF